MSFVVRIILIIKKNVCSFIDCCIYKINKQHSELLIRVTMMFDDATISLSDESDSDEDDGGFHDDNDEVKESDIMPMLFDEDEEISLSDSDDDEVNSSLPKPTKVQQRAVDTIVKEKKSCCVNAFAGSGKTTMIILAAQALYKETSKHTVLLTYSKALKTETRKRCRHMPYLHIESFHSSLNMKNGKNVVDDATMRKFLSNPELQANWNPKYDVDQVGLLAVDEVQDVHDTLFEVVEFVRTHVDGSTQLLLVGDVFQAIYTQMNGSKIDYLLQPDIFWPDYDFVHFAMRTSWRITQNIAKFINRNLNVNTLRLHYPEVWQKHGEMLSEVWGNGIIAGRKVAGPKVKMYQTNLFEIARNKKFRESISQLQKDGGNEGLTVLVNSTNRKLTTPGAALVNSLDNTLWRVVESGPQASKCAEDNISYCKNKSTICTVQSFKGKENLNILLVGYADGFEEGRSGPLAAFNLFYVACTRAQNRLVIYRDIKSPACFTTRKVGMPRPINRPQKSIGVLDSLAYTVHDPLLETVDTLIGSQTPTRHYGKNLVKFSKTVEQVSSFVGCAVEERIREVLMSDECLDMSEQKRHDWVETVRHVIETNGFQHYRRQIDHMRWVNPYRLDDLVRIAITLIRDAVAEPIVSVAKVCYRQQSVSRGRYSHGE